MRKFFVLLVITLTCLLACNGLAGQLPAVVPTVQPPASLPTATTASISLPTPTNLQPATVAEVVDGDTVALTNGRHVRYIGINTPEHDQPYFAEAQAANRKLVAGKDVQLELDVETFDQYGRTLAYLWSGGVMVNLEIVRQGFANAFTVPPNLRYEKLFQQAEQEARQAKRGLWADAGIPLKITHIEANAPGSDSANPNG
ncbi:MAG: thermonuclease family protein, partial [Anaerolineae bacterium]